MSLDVKTELTVGEALELYTAARLKLPREGEEFRGPGTAQAWADCEKAKIALDSAILRSVQPVAVKA